MSSELPPPVTRKSKKKDLWAEINALRDEVESQQSMINNMRRTRGYVLDRCLSMENQIKGITSALNGV